MPSKVLQPNDDAIKSNSGARRAQAPMKLHMKYLHRTKPSLRPRLGVDAGPTSRPIKPLTKWAAGFAAFHEMRPRDSRPSTKLSAGYSGRFRFGPARNSAWAHRDAIRALAYGCARVAGQVQRKLFMSHRAVEPLAQGSRSPRISAMRHLTLIGLLLVCSCGGTQEGLSNVKSLNTAPSEDLGHDVIANGPEACSPGVGKSEAVRLPQCPETASSAKTAPTPSGTAKLTRPPPPAPSPANAPATPAGSAPSH